MKDEGVDSMAGKPIEAAADKRPHRPLRWRRGVLIALGLQGWLLFFFLFFSLHVPLRLALWHLRRLDMREAPARVGRWFGTPYLASKLLQGPGWDGLSDEERTLITRCLGQNIAQGKDPAVALDALLKAVVWEHGSSRVAGSAVLALIDADTPEAWRALLEMGLVLQDEYVHVPPLVAAMARDHRKREAVPYLIVMLQSQPRYVANARAALCRITGQDLPADYAAWLAWFEERGAEELGLQKELPSVDKAKKIHIWLDHACRE